jgi:cephalosporin hydroxylase
MADTNSSSWQNPRRLYVTAIFLYGLALVQNIIFPLGTPSIVLTGILSFGGSLILFAAIMIPRLKRVNKKTLTQARSTKQVSTSSGRKRTDTLEE